MKEYYLYDDGYIVSSKPHLSALTTAGSKPQTQTFCISIEDIRFYNKLDKETLLQRINADILRANNVFAARDPNYSEQQQIDSVDKIDAGLQIQLQTSSPTGPQQTDFTNFAAFVQQMESRQKLLKHSIGNKTLPEHKKCIFVTYMGQHFQTAFELMQLKLLFTHQRKQYTKTVKQLVNGRDLYVKKFKLVNNYFGVSMISGNKLRPGRNLFQFFDVRQTRICGEFDVQIDLLQYDMSVDQLVQYDVAVMRKFDRIVSQKKKHAQTQTLDLVTKGGNIVELEE